MAAPSGLNDAFSLDGFWWLPEMPDLKVAGVLNFKQKQGPILTLTGTFDPSARRLGSEMQDQAVIHGLTKDNQAVSLFDALHTGRQGGFLEKAVQEVYKGSLLAVGWHFNSEDEPIFRNSFVSFEDIEEWLGHRFFNFDRIENTSNWSLEIDRPATRRLARIDGITLGVSSGFYTDGTSTSFTVSASCNIKIEPDEPQSLRWHLAAASKVQGLASLCLGRHLPLRMISFDGPEIRYSDEFTRPAEVRAYYSRVHQESQKTRTHETPMIQVTDFPEPADELMQKWFDSYDELSSGIYLFLTALADRAMFINVRFSLAVQALEVFHRRTYPSEVMAKEDHAALQTALLTSIPDGTPSAMRDKLAGLLAFSNEPSLGQRIRAMLKDVKSEFGEIPAGFDKAFVRRLVDTRNYYTHYSPNLDGKTLEGADMHYAIRRIVLLLIVLLLLRIGLPARKVRTAIDNHREFRLLWTKPGNPS